MMFSPNLVYGQDRLLKNFKTKVPVKPDKFVYISSGETGDLEAGYRKEVRRFDSLLVSLPEIKGFETRTEYLTNVSQWSHYLFQWGGGIKE